MRKLLRTSATVATALSIAGSGIAGVAGASSVTTQGPDSPIRIRAHNHQTVRNDNDVSVNSSNSQDAYTGNARVRNNTTGGNATSGMARNNNTTSTTVRISNTSLAGSMGGGGGGSDTVRTSGPNSPIRINLSNRTSVDNDNDVHVTNTSTQTASTGNASVSNNTTGGSARSGDATNTSSTVTSVTVNN